MKHPVHVWFLCVSCCLLGTLHCSADLDPSAVDQNTAVLLDRVLHSKEGHSIEPVTVVYVTPSDRYPNRLHRHALADRIYLVTKSQMFYSFYLTPDRLVLEWQTRLVPKNDKNAMQPTGPLGSLLERAGKRIPNHAAIGKQGNGGTFLGDMDNPSRLILYHLVEGRVVRADE